MNSYPFHQARFVKTAIWSKDYPSLKNSSGKMFPEIGIAGRSNVGKSSLLNHLFRHKNLVKTSSVPGKTQTLNFFAVDESLVFVDLPGYGYAKVPPKIKKLWGPMIQEYLESRESLQALLFLLDIRRIPNEDDLVLLQWALFHKIPLILVLTKVDKVKKNEKVNNTKKILATLETQLGKGLQLPTIHYSTSKNIGRKKLITIINETLAQENMLNSTNTEK